MSALGDCIYCHEDTGMGRPGCAHVVCRKMDEGVDPMDIFEGMTSCTMVPGQFNEELRRLFRWVGIKGPRIEVAK